MHPVRRFSTAIDAQLAAVELKAHGIEASVAGAPLQMLGPYTGSATGSPHVVSIGNKADVERARRIIDQMQHRTPEPGWESQAQPDLTRLDPDLRIVCPECKYDLLGIGDEGHCPECGHEFDLLSLVLTQHGPEALADCYDDDALGND